MSSGVIMGDTKIVGNVLLADETRTQPIVYLPMNEGQETLLINLKQETGLTAPEEAMPLGQQILLLLRLAQLSSTAHLII